MIFELFDVAFLIFFCYFLDWFTIVNKNSTRLCYDKTVSDALLCSYGNFEFFFNLGLKINSRTDSNQIVHFIRGFPFANRLIGPTLRKNRKISQSMVK